MFWKLVPSLGPAISLESTIENIENHYEYCMKCAQMKINIELVHLKVPGIWRNIMMFLTKERASNFYGVKFIYWAEKLQRNMCNNHHH